MTTSDTTTAMDNLVSLSEPHAKKSMLSNDMNIMNDDDDNKNETNEKKRKLNRVNADNDRGALSSLVSSSKVVKKDVDDNPIVVNSTDVNFVDLSTDKTDNGTMKEQQATLQQRLYEFQNQYHSLRISVSNIAAITGYHPYKDIPQLLLYHHVYQGRLGKLLLHYDTTILDIELVSDDQILQNLVNKVNNTETNRIVQQVLDIQRGTTIVSNIEMINAIKSNTAIVQTAKQQLSKDEYHIFQDSIRNAINTGYGIHLENDAMDIYEQQIGYPIIHRNLEICTWPFGCKNNNHNSISNNSTPYDNNPNDDTKNYNPNSTEPTVYPIRPATTLYAIKTTATTTDENEKLGEDDEAVKELPYFSIVGSVDGIREEMAPVAIDNTTTNTVTSDHHELDEFDHDPWEMRPVIVECKHRMKTNIAIVPPFYELIQTSIYCLMYNIQHADIIQIIRSSSLSTSSQNQNKTPSSTTTNVTSISKTITNINGSTSTPTIAAVTEDLQHQEDKDTNVNKLDKVTNDTNNNNSSSSTSSTNNVTIAVHRLDVDDPTLQHRTNFYNVILPRIQQFCNAVYEIRHNDHLRYSLLYAIASNNVEASWKIIFDLCPYLIHSDTAYRYMNNSNKHQEEK